MAFQFRFRKLLEHREHLVRQSQIELANALAEVREIGRRIAAVERQLQDTRERLSKKQREGISVAEFLSFQDHLSGLEQQLLKLNEQWEAAQHKAAARQEALVDREREAKKLERLEEIDHERFRIEEKKREQRHLDESAQTTLLRGPLPLGNEPP
ncbi:flagellar export protein FliJ [Desulfacinum infernum DSM 9756]|uniref:Flagellar FliJ protein n=1 Tax=Desulfacinum infernum DSM 9756 TaxID=1121391 RepID=A0A1M4UV01_9BACT|nr:flagellar export protein FliJ [Desulfacinum sp.]SHE60509.1 flagellar export protein FliJ [Desulfacinum infernum DSM 9756]